ncbi:C40 family peptidase [Acidiferrimicrobium sp. IK]|uniref:C40 family peptidase n=1 Tax=Acidiferrimicrobium sp. IK TaxID=2871700 RepID=UPI0021CB0CA2|nr:C40 family peptidase [Acidiferrimicrobium sp. IK]MCU4186578.1 C40 family peptidase [Acidiferrimicrobium sp. IK]
MAGAGRLAGAGVVVSAGILTGSGTAAAAGASTAAPATAVAAGAQAPSAPAPAGVVEPDGALFTTAGAYPSLPALNAPVVGWASAPGQGAWEVASDGGIFPRSAPYLGSLGNVRLNRPIVGMAPTPTGRGYWLVASDGGIFDFGDAGFFGSTGNVRLNQPIVGMAPTPTGRGYWLVASDGGIFDFGDASFFGSTGSVRLSQPIVGMTPSPTGRGYWLVASDGGVFDFGDAPFLGSLAGRASAPAVSVSAATGGYRVALADGAIWQFTPGSAGALADRLPVPSTYAAGAVQKAAAAKAVAIALSQVGKPYAVGAAGPGAFDCSGLTSYAYGNAGVALPRTTAQQLAVLPKVPLAAAQPGDLLFFYPDISHVGIYLGGGLMVDSPHVGAAVRVEQFSWFGPVMGVGRPG